MLNWTRPRSSDAIHTRARTEPEALDDEPGEHEDADDEGDRDRQQRHGQVVEDLPDRLEERPAVGPRHEDAVGGVEQVHPRREEHRQDEDRTRAGRRRSRAGGQHEQATRVAVSKPSPMSRPTVRCQGLLTRRVTRPSSRARKPCCRWCSASSNSPLRIRRKTGRCRRRDEVHQTDEHQERSATTVPISARLCATGDSSSWTTPATEYPRHQQQAGGEDHGGGPRENQSLC